MILTSFYTRVIAADPEVRQVFTEMVPPLTHGDPRNCFENARREFLTHKSLDRQYWVGWLTAEFDDPWVKNIPRRNIQTRNHHAWVTEGTKVYDSTPFKYGFGNFSDLPSKLPHELFDSAKYEGLYTVGEEALHNPLKYFPR